MEMENGKLFIGGISWDTSEERLREYFEAFGEVVEAVIMKDRTTGRARGFGFIVFANGSVAEKVVKERHTIDGRTVEAKKAVPRDDHQNFTRNNGPNSIQGSPSPARTKKIFVGGLASTVTETDFKRYFDQFGTITDVVVMYDHNTQRPRGFGFITFDSEEAVDQVLTKTFHELNGKMVEVKRAVPKESSPARTQSGSFNSTYGLNRVSSLLNAYSQGFNPSSGYGGMRMDGRFSPVSRSGYPPFSPSSYNMGMNLDSGFGLNYNGSNGDSGLGYGRAMNMNMNSYYSGNSSRYGSPGPIGYDVMNGGENGSLLNNMNRDLWGNSNLNYGTNSLSSNAFVGSGNGNLGSIREIWGSTQGGGNGNVNVNGNGNNLSGGNSIGYGSGDNSFGTRGGYGRNNGGEGAFGNLYSVANNNNAGEGAFSNLYGGESFYGENGWRSSTPELEGPGSFGYGLGAAADVAPNDSVGYVGGGYSVNNARSNRGIAA